MYYVNDYIDWDQFNYLYNLNSRKKGMKDANAVACKLGLLLTRAINCRLEIASNKRQKEEKIVKK